MAVNGDMWELEKLTLRGKRRRMGIEASRREIL